MAQCINCGCEFVSLHYQDFPMCQECVDMSSAEDSYDDVDEIQENEDFAHDDYFHNREDSYIDGYYESQNEYYNDDC